MKDATSLQIGMRFKTPETGGLINLQNLDLTQVNMQDPSIKDEFLRIATLFSKNTGNPPFYIDLSNSDISGADMRGYDLSNVIMSGVIARGTIFINTIFSDTHLELSNLENADFRQADLYHTKFFESEIKGANFSAAKMTHTHGLGLRNIETAVERLAIVGTIRDAILPDEIEKQRDRIQQQILKNREEVAAHKADIIEYEEAPENRAPKTANPVIGNDFFGSSWLEKNSDKPD